MNENLSATNGQMKAETVKLLNDLLKDKNREARRLENEIHYNHYHLHQIEQKLDKVMSKFNLKQSTDGGVQ